MTEDEFYNRLYGLCYITRYDTVPRVKDENVAEHSFLVSAMILKLEEVYSFDLGKALVIAVSHDILENETGDICHILKRNHLELYEVLKTVEKKALEKYPDAVRYGIKEYDLNSSVESKVVHLADSIQVLQYSTNEIRLGSNFYFDEVKENCLKRIVSLREELKEYKICQDT